MENKSEKHSTNNFDFIRFLAASFVIITHSQALKNLGDCDFLCGITNGTMQFSYLGVAVFFTISGYLITQSFFASKTYIAYLWKRGLRILPGLAVVLLLCAFVLGPLTTTIPLREYFSSPLTYRSLISLSLYKLYFHLPGVFVNNPATSTINGSLWTLAYEFSFYILVLLVGAIGLLKRRSLILAVWLLLLAVRIYLRDKYFIYSYTTPYLLGLNIRYVCEWFFYFGAGAILFLYKDHIKYNVLIFAAVCLLTVITAWLGGTVARVSYYLFLPYIIFYLAFLPGRLNHFGKYGDFSYGIYIYAFPVQQTLIFCFGNNLGLVGMIVLSFLCTLPLAVLSWHLVEKRALKLKALIK